MGKSYSRHFPKENIQTSNKCVNRCSGKCSLKRSPQHCTPAREAETENTGNIWCEQGHGAAGTFVHMCVPWGGV